MTAVRLRVALADDRDAVLDLCVAAWSAALPTIGFEARRAWFSARFDELEEDGAITLIASVAEAKRRSPQGLGLHVDRDDARASRFYEREGFATISGDINPRSGLPIWIMRWAPEP